MPFLCTPGSPIFPLSLAPRSPCNLFRAPRLVRPTVFPAFRVGKLFPPQAQDSALESLSGDPHLGREGVSLFERESAPSGQAPSPPHSQKLPSPLPTGAPAGWCVTSLLSLLGLRCWSEAWRIGGGRRPPGTRRGTAPGAAQQPPPPPPHGVAGGARGLLPLPASRPEAYGPARPTPRQGGARDPGSEERLGGESRRRSPRAAASVMSDGFGPRYPKVGWTPPTTTALLFERVGGSEKSL